MAEELTTKILIEIRDEIRSTRTELSARIDQTNARLDETNARLDSTNEKLAVLATITRGIDTRVRSIEAGSPFLTRRVEVLEERVQRLEDERDDG